MTRDEVDAQLAGPRPEAGGRTRRGWRAAAVVVAVFSLGVVTTAVALQPPGVPRDALLPADGAMQAVEINGLPGQLETAALQGRQVRGLGGMGVLAVETVPAADLPGTTWWRLGFTLANPQPVAGSSGALVPTTEFVLLRGDADDLSLVAVSLQRAGWVYTDPVPLPASGEQELTGRYTPPSGTPGAHRTKVVTSTTDGCRKAELQSDLDGLELDLELELCDGRFVRFSVADRTGSASVYTAADSVATPFLGEVAGVESRPVEGGWQVSGAKLVVADSALGAVAAWDVSSYLDPVVLRDETAVVARLGSQDLIAVDPAWEDGGLARVRWVAHPGGIIRTLTAAGDLTVAATSERALVGYGPDGIRQWRRELSDLVVPPLVADGDLLYAATVDGWLTAVDLRTGEPRWQERIGAHLVTGPALVPDANGGVAAGAADGALVRLGADGARLWETRLASSRPAVERLAATADQVFSVSDQLRAHSGADGSEQWAVSLASATPVGLAATDTMVGLATGFGVWAFEPGQGGDLWWTPEAVGAIRGRGSVLFAFRPGNVDAALADRDSRATWAIPGLNPNRGRCMCAPTPDGWLFSTGTTLTRLR